MAILYAPTIETPLPSFYAQDDIIYLSVPIIENKFMAKDQYTNFALLIKNNNTDIIIGNPILSEGPDRAYFVFTNRDSDNQPLLKVGNYYKIQIAYVVNDEIGKYSAAALIKFTAKPAVTGIVENNTLTFTYTTADPNERINTYTISIYDDEQLLYDTGLLLHRRDSDRISGSSLEDYELISVDQLTIPYDLMIAFHIVMFIHIRLLIIFRMHLLSLVRAVQKQVVNSQNLIL